jgi:hypothetical protein
MRAINAYILDDVPASRRILAEVRFATLTGSRRVQRVRLAILLAAMRLLVRLPWSAVIARALSWRRHGAGRPSRDRRVRLANA